MQADIFSQLQSVTVCLLFGERLDAPLVRLPVEPSEEGSARIGPDGFLIAGGQPAMWRFYFRVPDIDATAERIKANGGAIVYGPVEIPGGEFAVNATDPQDAVFGLVGRRTS
ncbi:MAG: hypothetical protein L0H63_07855 [Nitrococcus sp.]|nr:hypothetical protein [Nitrococcus sp.]